MPSRHISWKALPFCKVRLKALKPLPKGYPLDIATLGLELRRWRMDRNLSQAKLARLLGVSKSTIENWELGETEPSSERLPVIGRVLGRQVEDPGLALTQRLAAYRETAGVTRAEFARQLRILETTLLRWERGERLPRKSSRRVIEGNLPQVAGRLGPLVVNERPYADDRPPQGPKRSSGT
jgi:transcriptional regulator with XRE-family HTH domain